MKTTEFRCEKCNRLLAKLAVEWEFGDSSEDDRTYIIDGARQYLEVKCPRCKTINKKEMIGDACVFGKEKHCGTTVCMPKSQVGKGIVNTEALEALNRVSRHGDNI